MAGLLDINDEGTRMALSLLSAAGPSAQPQSFGQRLMGGLLQSQQLGRQQEQDKARAEMQAMQLQQHQMALAQAQREAQRQQQLQGMAQQFARSPTQSALMTGGGPTRAAEAALPTAQGGYDFAGYAQALAGIDPMASLQMQAALKKEAPKIKEFREVRGADGSVQIVGLDEYGKPVNTGQTPFKEGREVDLGGAKYERDPITGKLSLIGKKTMTPGEMASNDRARERLSFDKTQANGAVSWQQDADGNFVALPTKLTSGGPVRAVPAIAPGGMAPLQGKGAGMTEDQAKATGWLVQAQNAFKNMRTAGFDANGTPMSAAYPGPVDAMEKVGLGGVANVFRSKDRQAFIQASSSLSEALLRAATGAGVNKDEAAQKVQELTPRFGEDEAVTKQKMDAVPLYIESLKVRSGPGAKKAQGIGLSSGLPPDIADIMSKYGH